MPIEVKYAMKNFCSLHSISPLLRKWGFSFFDFTDQEKTCPPGEEWSECDAGCQHNCSNVGQVIICPRICIPGCVCDDPGTVRGPNGNCIAPPLCPVSNQGGRIDGKEFVADSFRSGAVSFKCTDTPYLEAF
ncbi:INVERT_DEFENSINS domain-containing protein [Trichonephila clavipes]|uniref:INVERT_DEFENSINS domain-containing protein n=1 Tax=Trichonephila clavipes TaxID=2585209 RepID=A0A8X7B884_TRICX|nr:INVERT_DEFENSINS domain-containing protein [Trichonephila clavipes]